MDLVMVSFKNKKRMDETWTQMLQEQETFLSSGQSSSVKMENGKQRNVSSNDVEADISETAKEKKGDENENDENPNMIWGEIREHKTSVVQAMTINIPTCGFPSTKVPFRTTSTFKNRQKKTNATSKTKTTSSDVVMESGNVMDNTCHGADALLTQMSLDEIETAQQELYASFTPELLHKLKTRSQKNDIKTTKDTKTSTMPSLIPLSEIKTTPIMPLSSITNEEELQTHVNTLGGEEGRKVEWMKDVEACPETSSKNSDRFGFDGLVISKIQAAHSGLYHHGEEPSRAGYTLEELCLLMRSTVPSQRAMALQVITKILNLRGSAADSDTQGLPPTLGLGLRMALDDRHETALHCAITALHAYVVPLPSMNDTPFESFRGELLSNPAIKGEEDGVDETTLSDMELMHQFPLAGLLRTEIMLRMQYLLQLNHLTSSLQMQLLEILKTIVYSSKKGALRLVEYPQLLNTIQSFWSVSMFNNPCAVLALQLIRVLSQQDQKIAKLLVEKEIVSSALGYLALCDNSTVLIQKCQLEALRIWRVCLSHELELSSFTYLFPLLCETNKSWSLSHQAAIYHALAVVVSRPDPVLHDNCMIFVQAAFRDIPLWIEEYTSSSCCLMDVGTVLGGAYHFLSTFYTFCEMSTVLSTGLKQHMLYLVTCSFWEKNESVLDFMFLNILLSILQLLNHTHVHVNIAELVPILSDTLMATYLKRVLHNQQPSSLEPSCTRLIPHLVLECCHYWTVMDGMNATHLTICMNALSSVLPGEESIGMEIMTKFIFNASLLSQIFQLPQNQATIKMHIHHLISIYGQLLCSTPCQLPLPNDWVYFPLSKMEIPEQGHDMISATIWYLTLLQPTFVNSRNAPRSLFHLVQVFLQAPSLWQDTILGDQLSLAMTQCLETMSDTESLYTSFSTCLVHKDTIQDDIKTNASMLDFIESILGHFSSESAGQVVFGQCILLFLQHSFSVKHRLVVWKEMNAMKRYSFLKTFTVPMAVNGCLSTTTVETNDRILAQQGVALVHYSCHWKEKYRNDFIYGFIIHTLCAYLFRDLKELQEVTVRLQHPSAWSRQQLAKSLVPQLCPSVLDDLLQYSYAPAETIIVDGITTLIAFPCLHDKNMISPHKADRTLQLNAVLAP